MGKTRFFIFVFLIMIFFLNCGEKKNSSSDTIDSSTGFHDSTMAVVDSAKPEMRDTSVILPEPFMDSIYLLHVNGKEYQLVLSHEIPSKAWRGDLSTTVRIVANPGHDTLYKKTFDFNTCGAFANPAPDHYWLDLYNSGGGSGFSGKIFNIKIDSVISLQPLVSIDELSYWKSNRTATAFIFSEGIWNMSSGFDSKNFESHFDKHKQAVSIYEIEEDTVRITDLGITKNKLDFSENDNPLKEFRVKESEMAKKINWEDYDIPE